MVSSKSGWLAALGLSFISSSYAHKNFRMPPGIPIITDYPKASGDGPPLEWVYYFDQLIDHDDPSKGTFKQRFWHNAEFYQPGGPVVLLTPGEANAFRYTGYLTNVTLPGKLAQLSNGTAILLEHRFYGESNPYPNLKTESFKVHTIDQAIEDLDYFARNVILPQVDGDKMTPDHTPWVFVGGSYSGALVSWARYRKPNLFWAGYSSSGVVQAIFNFWEYFEPIRQNMARNCSTDITRVIEHVDRVFSGKDQRKIQKLKENWGLGNLSHVDDVAGALRNNLWDWQSLQPNSVSPVFYKFCDALEVKDGQVAGPNGWGLRHALKAWGKFWTEGNYYTDLCDDETPEECLGTHDPNSEFYTSTEIDNLWRSWNWIVCNDVGWLQEGAPRHRQTLVTRLVQPPYELNQCQLMYPEAFGDKPPRTAIRRTNTRYGGWDIEQERTFFANGKRDPWLYATMSAPRSPAKSTDRQPIGLSNGFHCSDLSLSRGAADASVAEVQNLAFDKITGWVAEWTPPTKEPVPATIAPSSGEAARLSETHDSARTIPVSGPKPVNAWLRGSGSF